MKRLIDFLFRRTKKEPIDPIAEALASSLGGVWTFCPYGAGRYGRGWLCNDGTSYVIYCWDGDVDFVYVEYWLYREGQKPTRAEPFTKGVTFIWGK